MSDCDDRENVLQSKSSWLLCFVQNVMRLGTGERRSCPFRELAVKLLPSIPSSLDKMLKGHPISAPLPHPKLQVPATTLVMWMVS